MFDAGIHIHNMFHNNTEPCTLSSSVIGQPWQHAFIVLYSFLKQYNNQQLILPIANNTTRAMPSLYQLIIRPFAMQCSLLLFQITDTLPF